MEIDEQEAMDLELKYCERCGVLWLRTVGDEEVYCPACMPLMADLPPVRKRGGGERVIVHSDVDMEASFEELVLLCSEGGNA
jgi:hypothetical protein